MGFDSQPYYPPGYERPAQVAPEAQSFDAPTHDAQAYDSQAYDSQAYDSQAYDSQAYDSQAYDSQAYDSQAYDSQAPGSEAYDSQQLAVPQHEVYDSQAYLPQEQDDLDQRQPISESHVQELPSWWSDDAATPESGELASPSYLDRNVEATSWPAESQMDYAAEADERVPSDTGYTPSAFSAEQLELSAPSDNPSTPPNMPLANGSSEPLIELDSYYDSVPYSELVNRRPASTDDVQSDQLNEYKPDFAPYNSRSSELVPVGAEEDDQVENYSEQPSEDYADNYSENNYADNNYAENNFADIAQPDHMTQSVPTADNPTVPAPASQTSEEGDESVEDYMRRLLARMRGVSESEVTLPGTPSNAPASAVVSKEPSAVKPAPVAQAANENEPLSEAWTEPFDPDNYVPVALPPRRTAT